MSSSAPATPSGVLAVYVIDVTSHGLIILMCSIDRTVCRRCQRVVSANRLGNNYSSSAQNEHNSSLPYWMAPLGENLPLSISLLPIILEVKNLHGYGIDGNSTYGSDDYQ